MTWKQFKDAVEAAGMTDEDVVSWIDWSTGANVVVDRYAGRIAVCGEGDR